MTKGTRTELEEQVALFNWAKYIDKRPELEMMLAIPNGGYRPMSEGKKLKASGVKQGVPDIFLAYPIGNYSGLWIEMKRCDPKARATPAQRQMLCQLQQVGYAVAMCFGADDAIAVIEGYLAGQEVS